MGVSGVMGLLGMRDDLSFYVQSNAISVLV